MQYTLNHAPQRGVNDPPPYRDDHRNSNQKKFSKNFSLNVISSSEFFVLFPTRVEKRKSTDCNYLKNCTKAT